MHMPCPLQVDEGADPSAFRSTRFLQFDLSSSPLKYHTGDHAAILPHNDPSEVSAFCEVLKVAPEQWVNITGERVPVAVPATLGHIFSQELDLATSAGNLSVSTEDGNISLPPSGSTSRCSIGDRRRTLH